MHVRTRKLALTEGIAAGITFGSAAILIRFLQDMDVFAIAFWRLIVACVSLATVLLVLRASFDFKQVKRNMKELLALSFFLGLHFIFFISAVKDTTILNATVLVNTTPVFSMLVSGFLFKLKPSRLAIMGLIVSFAGTCVIAYAEAASSGAAFPMTGRLPSLKGDIEAVLAAVVESFYLNFGRGIRKRLNVFSIMASIYLFTTIVVGMLSVPAGRNVLALPVGSEMLAAVVALGVLPTAVAHTLYFSSLSNLKSFETATMALLEPIGATILGIAVFQEIPASLFVVGAGLVLVGVASVVVDRS